MNNYNKLKEQYNKSLEDMMSKHQEEIEKLMNEHRQDEANLEKIQFNVVDIFYKMFQLSIKQMNDNTKIELLEKKYQTLLNKIMTPWQQKLEKAKEHDDSMNVLVEELKLNKAKAIIDLFKQYTKEYQ